MSRMDMFAPETSNVQVCPSEIQGEECPNIDTSSIKQQNIQLRAIAHTLSLTHQAHQ